MDIDRAILVVVDMQEGFVRNESRHVVPRVTELIARWDSAGGSIVFTRFFNYAGSPFERLIGWKRMCEAPETDLVPELAPHLKGHPIVDKTIYSLFEEKGARLVAERDRKDLVICGIATESCVCKTAVDAFERDLTPWVVTDACASHAGQEAHDAGLLVTSRFIGRNQLITSSEVVDRVTHPTA